MDILTFLTEPFNSCSLAYRTIGVYEACISQLHRSHIEDRQVGNLPLVFEHPFEPKSCSTWSAEKVLRHFASCSLKDLSLKLIILLALTSAARAHELAALDLTYIIIVRKEDSWEFPYIPIHVKNSRPYNIYHASRKIFLARYQANQAICVVRCLNHYLQCTEQIREGKNLLISYVSPHNAVGSQTMSRWFSAAAIQKAGVELSYKGHSTRAASTSGVPESGLPLKLVWLVFSQDI